MSKQRSDHSKEKLRADRSALLSELPGWSWDPVGDAWERGFQSLQRFVELEGHAYVPARHELDGFKLGLWIDQQRGAFKKKKLSAERERRLRDLGFDLRGRSGAWDRNFLLLRQYVEREGDARVSSEHRVGDVRLGRWVVKQRAARRKGKLTADQIERLQGLTRW